MVDDEGGKKKGSWPNAAAAANDTVTVTMRWNRRNCCGTFYHSNPRTGDQ